MINNFYKNNSVWIATANFITFSAIKLALEREWSYAPFDLH
jgi:hypothetical protein